MIRIAGLTTKRLATMLALLVVFAQVAGADVAIPAGTAPVLRHQDHRGNDLYRVRKLYLRDADTNTMGFSAPTNLTGDSYDFVLPGADGTANQCLATDGAEALSWIDVVRPTATQTLTAKTFDDALTLKQVATPSNPSASYNKVYVKSDGLLYKLDSTGNEAVVGSGTGAGEINAATNGSGVSGTTGWTNGTSHTIAKVTGANSPLNPAVSTAFSITATSTAAESSTSGSYHTFTMPAGLRSKKLKVETYFTTEASQTWAVSLRNSSGRLTMSTDSSGATTLPAGTTGKFVGYVDTDTDSGNYTLHFTRTAGAGTAVLYITNVIVGPGIQPQGMAGEYLGSLTFTGAWNTNTSYTGRGWRIGDSLHAKVKVTISSGSPNNATFYLTMPTGYTIDSSKLASTTGPVFVGHGSVWNDSTSEAFDAQVEYSNTTTLNLRAIRKASGVNNTPVYVVSSATAGNNYPIEEAYANGDQLYLEFVVPIAEWAGSGTVNVAQNDVEYAYNSSGTTAAGGSNTTSFAYGPGGAAIGSIDAATVTGNSTTTMRVRFQTPIQPTDVVTLEVNNPSYNTWVEAGMTAVASYTQQNTGSYGVGLSIVNATDVDVKFGNGGRDTSGGSYGVAGNSWAGISSWKWRVKKVSAGAAVGFGLASSTSSGLVSREVGITSWTPALTFSGGNGTMTASTQTGTYTRVGKTVFFTCLIDSITKGTASGNITITGLPVTSSSTSNTAMHIPMVAENITGLGAGEDMYAAIGTSSATLILRLMGAGSVTALAAGDLAASGVSLRISGFYFVD